MPFFVKARSLVRNLFLARRVEAELDNELRAHLEMLVEEKVIAGTGVEEARRAARIEMGGVEQVKEQVHERQIGNWVQSVLTDCRYAVRQLWKSPGFTVVAVLTLSLGIGLNSVIFALFDALMFRPQPMRDPSAVVNVYQQIQDASGGYRSFSYPEFTALREFNECFSGVLAYSWTTAEIATAGRDAGAKADEVQGLLVTADYFPSLGGEIVLGRTFSAEEETRGGAPVIILSHSFWSKHFQSDPSIIGRSIKVNSFPATVVGITAESFAGTESQIPDFWAPMVMQSQVIPDEDRLGDRGSFWLDIVARLKPSVSRAEAEARTDALINRIAPDYLGTNQKVRVELAPATLVGRRDIRGQICDVSLVVVAAVGMILLIGCVNVANLSLSRAAVRHKEIGVRLSLGASRGRIIQLVLAESLLVAFLSGAAGLLLARFLPEALLNVFRPLHEQRFSIPVVLDLRMVSCTMMLSLGTALISGLIPALRAARTNHSSRIKGEISIFGRQSSRLRVHGLLAGTQISVCLVLLLCAGLLVRALRRAETLDPGFDMQRVLALSMDLNLHGYDNQRAAEFHHRLLERLKPLPGVKTVSVASLVPLGGVSRTAPVTVEGSEVSGGESQTSLGYWVVSPNYFRTLSIPIVRGRDFESRDTRANTAVAIINESLARKFWPGQDATGKRLRPGPPVVPFAEVIGVAKNVRGARLWEADQPYVYLPLLDSTQGPATQTQQLGMKLLVRVEGNLESVSAVIPRVTRELDPNVQVSLTTLGKSAQRWIWFSKIAAMLSSGLGVVGLLLASVGIYGVMSYAVTQRTHELGVRTALGASHYEILKLVLGQSLRITLLAVVAGAGIALAVTRVMRAGLYGVKPADPATFAGLSIFLIAVASLASYFPARRAMRVDPMEALRYE